MSFLGFIGKALVGTVGGLLSGGPVGAIVGGLTSVTGLKSAGSSGGGVMPAAAPTNPLQTYYGRAFTPFPSGGLNTQLGRSLMAGGGATGGTTAAAAPAAVIGSGDCNIRGHHLNKSKYYVRGSMGNMMGPTTVEKGTRCVKNRHMNVGNARALRKALRRAYGFEKLAMRTIRLLHPSRHGRFGGFKKTRARARR
jgi:hypothetical protein